MQKSEPSSKLLTSPQFLKSKQKQVKPKKNIFSFIDVKLLIIAKHALESLPEGLQYELEQEPDYARKMTEALRIVAKIRVQQIEYVVSANSLKKILTQLARQVQFKQIVIVLLKEILKGVSCYQQILMEQLFDMLSFLVQMQGLSLQLTAVTQQSQSKKLKKSILANTIHQLIASIAKWYGCSTSGMPVAQKYRELLLLMES